MSLPSPLRIPPSAIHRVDDHKVACQVDPSPCRRKDARFRHVIPQCLACLGTGPRHAARQKDHEEEEHAKCCYGTMAFQGRREPGNLDGLGRPSYCAHPLVHERTAARTRTRGFDSLGKPTCRASVHLHDRTSEITPRESANVSASTPIFCAIVSSKLLKWALVLTGL